MKLILKLAWRNIWRNKRRLFLTLFAIAFATLAAISMRGMQLGTYGTVGSEYSYYPAFLFLQGQYFF